MSEQKTLREQVTVAKKEIDKADLGSTWTMILNEMLDKFLEVAEADKKAELDWYKNKLDILRRDLRVSVESHNADIDRLSQAEKERDLIAETEKRAIDTAFKLREKLEAIRKLIDVFEGSEYRKTDCFIKDLRDILDTTSLPKEEVNVKTIECHFCGTKIRIREIQQKEVEKTEEQH